MNESPKAAAEEWALTPVTQWVSVFYHAVWSEGEDEGVAEQVIRAGATLEEPPPPELYFEPPVLELTKARAHLKPLELDTSLGKPIRITPTIHLLPFAISILALKCEPIGDARWNLPELLRFNENYRYMRMRGWQSAAPAFELRVLKSSLQILQPGSVTRMDGVVSGLLRENGLTLARPVYETFAKMHLACLATFEAALSDADRYHLVFVDSPPDKQGKHGDPLPSQEFFDQTLRDSLYRRWTHHGQYFAFAGHSFLFWLEPLRAGTLPAAQLVSYWQSLYLVIYTVLLFQQAALTLFSRRAAQIEEEHRRDDEPLPREVRMLRRDLLDFSNRSWFARVTYEIQGTELVDLGRKAMGLDALYQDARQKLSEFDDYLLQRQQSRINDSLHLLQWMVLAVGLFGLAAAFLQFASARDFVGMLVADWLGDCWRGQLPLIIAVLGGTCLVCGTLSVGRLIFLWLKQWRNSENS